MKRRFNTGREQGRHAKPPHPGRFETPVTLSFRHARAGGIYCLSESEKNEVRDVVDCLRRLTEQRWIDVLKSGGKSGKTGLGYTEYKDADLKGATRPAHVSPDLAISGIRASGPFRVFGVYLEHVYYVIWFDRSHKIVPFHDR